MEFQIQIASVPDRERVVAEIWYENFLIAELNNDSGELKIELYQKGNVSFGSLNYSDFLTALTKAGDKLISE